MATPNMATIAAALERSLQNCSLNHHHDTSSSSGGGGAAHGSDSPGNLSTLTVELNSQNSLPYHWEQCLDLKTGEKYFINWRSGMKAEEDPRTTAKLVGDYYSDDNSSSYGSEESSSESSPSSSREQWTNSQENYTSYYYQERMEKNIINNNIDPSSSSSYNNNNNNNNNNSNSVLVLGGCKSCFMYYMVPKQLESCPKCCGELLHFDRSGNGSL